MGKIIVFDEPCSEWLSLSLVDGTDLSLNVKKMDFPDLTYIKLNQSNISTAQ